MLRLSLAAVLFISGALAVASPSHAANAWQEDRKLSREFAENGEWKRACRRGVLAAAAMAKEKALTVEYMARVGKRCTEAGRTEAGSNEPSIKITF